LDGSTTSPLLGLKKLGFWNCWELGSVLLHFHSLL
jgi:hypothetical protein